MSQHYYSKLDICVIDSYSKTCVCTNKRRSIVERKLMRYPYTRGGFWRYAFDEGGIWVVRLLAGGWSNNIIHTVRRVY